MPEWILALSIGPVGGFIGGGRRSRDLWWGSTWVSECTLAAARALPEDGLIVPSSKRVQDLSKETLSEREQAWRYGGRISNQVLARVTAEGHSAVEALARQCEKEAHRQLAVQLRKSRRSVEARPGKTRAAIGMVLDTPFFEQQVEAVEKGEFVEFFAAWTPLTEDLTASIRRVRQLLDARKTARLFDAPRTSRPGRRKSDLDAGRDSVLRPSRESDQVVAAMHLARRRLGIGTDEELDAVGLARRIAVFERDAGVAPDLGRLPFPPITRTAIDPWLRRVAADPASRADLESIKRILEKAKRDEIFFTWCSPALDPEVAWEDRDKQPGCFPFDASLLMEGGLEALYREVERIGQRLHDRRDVEETLGYLDQLTPAVRRLHGLHGPPPPYFALLFMDGDGVGRALAERPDQSGLVELVRQLDYYADEAEPTLRKQHLGRAFYLGGDDLAAYLPVDQALGAATTLANHFRSMAWPSGEPLTLSAGIVIGHAKADLRALRRRAQEALSEAKKLRAKAVSGNGTGRAADGWLQIVELPRSGSARSCAGPLGELTERMLLWQRLLDRGALSLRSPRLLLELHERFADPRAGDGGNLGIELARHRLRAQAARSTKEEDPALVAHAETITCWAKAEALARELVIAARFHRIGQLRPPEKRQVRP
jgi:CRISPR-associated protein Cmr2